MLRKKRVHFSNLIYKLPKYPSIVYILRARHMFNFFIKFNSNLERGEPGRAIEFNWGKLFKSKVWEGH
jgi:hypothetical protein